MDYFISFLAVALFPLALAAYGGHLAAVVLEGKKKTKALLIVWSLATMGVFLAALQQYNSYRTDRSNEAKQGSLQGKLDASLLTQARMGGQLDSIGQMLGKIGEKSVDPSLKELASAVIKIAETATKPMETMPTGLRLGTGPDAYKGIPDKVLGEWTMKEADHILQMALNSLSDMRGEMDRGDDGHMSRVLFAAAFTKCCEQDVKDLRTELLRRLGAPGKDLDEERRYDALFEPDKSTLVWSVELYAPYLRRSGLALRRRVIPRAAPKSLHFSERKTAPDNPQLPYALNVTVYAKTPITAGYIVVDFDRPGPYIRYDRPTISRLDLFSSSEVVDYLKTHRGGTPLEIGPGPITPDKPMHVFAEEEMPFHVTKVTWFDER